MGSRLATPPLPSTSETVMALPLPDEKVIELSSSPVWVAAGEAMTGGSLTG